MLNQNNKIYFDIKNLALSVFMIMVNCFEFPARTHKFNLFDFEILVMKVDKHLQLVINYVIKIIYKVNKTSVFLNHDNNV